MGGQKRFLARRWYSNSSKNYAQNRGVKNRINLLYLCSMVKVESYRYRDSDVVYSKELWYDVSNQVFYGVNDGVFGTGIVVNGVAIIRK